MGFKALVLGCYRVPIGFIGFFGVFCRVQAAYRICRVYRLTSTPLTLNAPPIHESTTIKGEYKVFADSSLS